MSILIQNCILIILDIWLVVNPVGRHWCTLCHVLDTLGSLSEPRKKTHVAPQRHRLNIETQVTQFSTIACASQFDQGYIKSILTRYGTACVHVGLLEILGYERIDGNQSMTTLKPLWFCRFVHKCNGQDILCQLMGIMIQHGVTSVLAIRWLRWERREVVKEDATHKTDTCSSRTRQPYHIITLCLGILRRRHLCVIKGGSSQNKRRMSRNMALAVSNLRRCLGGKDSSTWGKPQVALTEGL